MTRILLIALGLWSLNFHLFSQNITINGESPNYYLKVDEVFANSVRITETLPGQIANFAPGDKVLIIQMTGVSIDSSLANFKTVQPSTRKSVGNTGRFEVLQIDEVIIGADTLIYFTDNFTHSYDNVEKIQLVKVIEGETVTVNGTLTSKAWDGKVGGIIAIIGIDTIKLASNSILDVSGKGFRGGLAPVETYPDNLCRYGLSAAIKDTLYFRSNELYRSGNKGEGIITTQWPYTKGTGFNFNGGGAGNGLFSGGGGGSNYLAGGDGGQQSASCTAPYSVKGGWGGYSCWEFYFDGEKPKVVFGGGGGSGNRKSGSTPSNGGNGGGMIFLITGTVVTGSNVIIRANGANAWPATTTGSGAGGGGGGAILIDATEFNGPRFTIEIKGGNGSSTTTPTPNVNGAGGGGSGGVFWHTGTVSPLITLDSLNGTGGITPGGSSYPFQLGIPGLQGVRLQELIIPLTGFLFNTVRGTDTICESQFPNILTASHPKGGNGIYTYIWQQSTDNFSWSAAIGEEDLRSFIPVALNQTTFYRRIVNSRSPVTGEEIHDTSRVVKVFVYPAIANNTVMGTDTICYNSDANIVSGSLATGGSSIYSYIWQSSTDLEQWSNTGTLQNLDPAELTVSTSFRRIVNSTAYCSDTSNHIEIAVLPAITGNNFYDTDTAICEGTSPGRIIIGNPVGGDGSFTYQWQSGSAGNWNSLTGTTDSLLYTEGILTATTEYRRIVYSGYNDACIDTSNTRTITVRPQVSNNFIEGSAIQYTCFNSPVSLTGSNPADGFGPGTYSYIWEESSDNTIWQDAQGTTRDYQSGDIISTHYYRRKVYSTPQYHECLDISPSVEVRINPLPTGNLYSTSDTICAGSPVQVKFNLSGNGPFNVTVGGEIESPRSLTGITGTTDSIEFNPTTTQEFIMVSVEDDSGCFADPAGFIPIVPAEVYAIPVANAGPDELVCGNTHILSAVKSNTANIGLWTASDAVFSDSSLVNAVTTANYYGDHVFKWTETNWECSDDDEVTVTFFEQPQIPDAGLDKDLYFTFTTQLQASSPSAGSGTWSISSGSAKFSDNSLPNALVSELDFETILRWTVVNGSCPAVSDSVKIIVRPLDIKKAITPNGDGVNDLLNAGIIDAERVMIRIFNRSGYQIYEWEGSCDGQDITGCNLWDGKNDKNLDLPEGTYFYIIRIKTAGREKEFEFKSFIEIIR